MKKADEHMRDRGHIYVGCTACICIVSKGLYILVNIGDSRAVLSKNGVAQRLTMDHKATDKQE